MIHERSWPLDAIGREFGDQGRMPDHIRCSRYGQRNGPDLMSDIEGFHPLLGEYKQHVQDKMIGSETELMI